MGKTVFLLVAVLILVQTQEIIQNSEGEGSWSTLRKNQRPVPRHYICGVQFNQFTFSRSYSQVCINNRICNRRWGIRSCKNEAKCHVPPSKLEWIRSNGIRFRFCHIQKWEDQYTIQEHGSWSWKGMKMCGVNQLVMGYKIKLTARDGISGLSIFCRNPYNTLEQSQVLVMDGQGEWSSRVTNSLISSFKIKKNVDYINGLWFELLPAPQINLFTIDYVIPKNLVNTKMQTIDTVSVTNYAKVSIKKTVEFNKVRQFQRGWQVDKNQISGFNIAQMFTPSLAVSASIQVPMVSTKTKIRSISQTNIKTAITTKQQNVDKFLFGTIEKVAVGQTQRDEIQVRTCTKMTIRLVVYSGHADIPYVATIGYINRVTNEVDTISGRFRGVLASNAESIFSEEKVC